MSDMLLGICLQRGLDATYASSGAELMMPCPLCDDHKQRLYVNRETLKWTCFNCQAAGYGERFLTDVLLIDPIMAHRIKGQLLGDIAVIHSVKYQMKVEASAGPMEWPPFTMSFAEEKVDGRYWQYLIDRGLTRYEIEHYDIRWCPMGKYAERVIVPVYMDRVLRGWVARLIRPAGEHEQKVLTPPGMKSSMLLFGLDAAWHSKSVVLVEGVFDAIAFPDGVAIASLGAKLSPVQRHLIRKRGIEQVIIMYDNDDAGWKGTKRAARELVAAGFEVEVAMLPEGIDPGSAAIVQLEAAIRDAFPINGIRSMQEIERQVKHQKGVSK